MNPVAAPRSARQLYEVFLERVIRIDAVQRHRAAVTDDHTAQFFAAGRRPGVNGDFKWSLNAPTAFDWGPVGPFTGEKPAPMSPAMQQAWDAAVAAWRKTGQNTFRYWGWRPWTGHRPTTRRSST